MVKSSPMTSMVFCGSRSFTPTPMPVMVQWSPSMKNPLVPKVFRACVFTMERTPP